MRQDKANELRTPPPPTHRGRKRRTPLRHLSTIFLIHGFSRTEDSLFGSPQFFCETEKPIHGLTSQKLLSYQAPMPSILVIYHSADLDGLCSREVARHFLGEYATYLGWDYGQPIPDTAVYDQVYLIDVSFPRPVMQAKARKLIWIDHHKSAIEAMAGLPLSGYRIDGVAACRLAWQWFGQDNPFAPYPGKQAYVDRLVNEPEAVRLLGEYDIWDKRDPDVDTFQLGMQALPEPQWGRLFSGDGVGEIVESGEAIKAYTDKINAEVSMQRGFDVTFEGLRFRALNIARCNSLTFMASIRPEHEGCLAYYWQGSAWRFSLYHAEHRKDIDLSLIAVKFGGGGHRGACGFELKVLPACLGGGA